MECGSDEGLRWERRRRTTPYLYYINGICLSPELIKKKTLSKLNIESQTFSRLPDIKKKSFQGNLKGWDGPDLHLSPH